jgi:predicted Zn finger-like uncharacterized protein
MAQAARCPHCQTTFKVVRDQLLLREGWVRCGHCGQPFNALDHLIELQPPDARPPEPTAAAPSQPAPPPAAAPEPAVAAGVTAAGRIGTLQWSQPVLRDRPAAEGFSPLSAQPYAPAANASPLPGAAPAAPATAPSADAVLQTVPASASPASGDDAGPLSEFHLDQALNYQFDRAEPESVQTVLPEPDTQPPPEPEFVRQVDRRARWHSAPVRIALGLASLLLALLLAAQTALFWRDELAQQWPTSRPWLQRLCQATTGCELSAPRDLDALVIDSSSLNPAATGLRLDVLLRNRTTRAVAWPAIELTLTDAQGRVTQRKVLPAAAYLPAAQDDPARLRGGIAAGEQVQLQLHLTVQGTPPEGYKLLLFYP